MTQELIKKYDHLRDIPDAVVSRLDMTYAKVNGMNQLERDRDWYGRARKKCGNGSQSLICHVCECNKNDHLSELMREFHSSESFGTKIVSQPLESLDDIRARKVLEATTGKVGQEFENDLI